MTKTYMNESLTSPSFRTAQYEVRFWEDQRRWYVVNRETGNHVGEFFTSQGAAERWMIRCQEDYEARRTIGERIPKVGHRSRGTAAASVRLVAPAGRQSGRLYIGLTLWEQIGAPPRVDLHRPEAGGLLITAGDTFAVTARTGTAIPRVSIGQATCESIGLEPGTYPATVDPHARSISVSRSTEGE